MNSVFEINTVNNVTDVATDRVKKTSPIVEVFSAPCLWQDSLC